MDMPAYFPYFLHVHVMGGQEKEKGFQAVGVVDACNFWRAISGGHRRDQHMPTTCVRVTCLPDGRMDG